MMNAIKEIDLWKPMHFTKEQSEWIKQYVILKRKEAVEEYVGKYKWHDLRKNPNDLPSPEDNSVMYECVLENHIYDAHYPCFYFDDDYTHSFGYYNSIYAIRNGVDEFETIEDMGYEKVIAWREIKHFEEEDY